MSGQVYQLQDVLDQDPESLLARIDQLEQALAEERAEKEQSTKALQAEIARLHRIIDDEPWVDDLFAKSQRIANPKEKLIAWGYRKVFPSVPLNADGLGESPATEISRITGIPRASVLATLCRFGRMGLLNHPPPDKEPLFDEVTGEPILYKKGKRKGQQAWTSTSFSSPTDVFDDLARWDAPPELEHKPSGYHPPKDKAPIPTCPEPDCGKPATQEHSHYKCPDGHEWDITTDFEKQAEEDEESQSAFSDDLYDAELAAICSQEPQSEEVPPPESENAICPATLIKEETQIAFAEGYEAGYQAQDEKPALEELRKYAQWVCWRYGTLRKNMRREKVPYQARTNARASHSNPATWSTFDQAKATYEASQQWKIPYDGIGFVFSKDDPFTGGDLDHCIDENGILSDQAQDILRNISSYAEKSPSRSGVKFIVKASIPANIKTAAVELYDHDRYFTFTGEQLPGTPAQIASRQSEIDALYQQIAPPAPALATSQACASIATEADDQALLERALQDDKFARLMAGDTSEYGGDESRADMALVRKLAFYTGNDPARIDALFRQSGLYREKWDERRGGKTYGQITIEKVVGCPTVQTKPPPEMTQALREAVLS